MSLELMLLLYFVGVIAIGQFFYWVMRLEARRRGKEAEFLGKEKEVNEKIK